VRGTLNPDLGREAVGKRKRRGFKTILLPGLLLFLLGFGFFRRHRMAPGEPWEVWSDPQDAGFSPQALEEVHDFARSVGTTGLMVIVGGKVLLEEGDVEARGYLAAGRYSLAAMAFGRYVEDGTVDLSTTLEEMRIEDYGGLLPMEKRATVEDLLTFRSATYHPTPFGPNNEEVPPRGSEVPGSSFYFHPWAGLVTKPVFELLTGIDLFQAFGEDIGAPLGLQDFKWWRMNPGHQRNRSRYTIYNFYMSTRDIARLGQLLLREGQWEGEEIIPAPWVHRMTTQVTPPEEVRPQGYRSRGLGFGYFWWTWNDPDPRSPFAGAYTYIGSYGQYLTILPAMDMVVAHQLFAGWFGAPEGEVTWEEYMGILDRVLAARSQPRAVP
jgi:hypothetical protein